MMRLDDVRTRDDREFVTNLVEVLASPHVLRECEHAGGFPEVAPVRFLGCHADGQAIDDFRAFKAAEPHLENRREVLFVHDDVVVELNIFSGDGLAIAPLRARRLRRLPTCRQGCQLRGLRWYAGSRAVRTSCS